MGIEKQSWLEFKSSDPKGAVGSNPILSVAFIERHYPVLTAGFL